jgi:lambda family phage portal protein
MNGITERWDSRTATWVAVPAPATRAESNVSAASVGRSAQPAGQFLPARPGQRSYHAAQVDRLTAGWRAPNNSADSELAGALRQMRGRSRACMRDVPYAKRAKVVVVNNVIGAGVGLQGNIRTADGKLQKSANDGIEAAWCKWSRAENCHTGGALHFSDLERAAMGQVFEAGEIFIRLHGRQFGASDVPLALELIEAERIADDFSQPIGANGENQVRMGVEVDTFGRAVAYWIREHHPSEIRYAINATDKMVRVPAEQIIHLRIVDRWPQTRGEPWLHSTMRRLNDMEGYSEAEIVAARGAAAYMAFIKTPDNSPIPVDDQVGDQRVVDMSPASSNNCRPGGMSS